MREVSLVLVAFVCLIVFVNIYRLSRLLVSNTEFLIALDTLLTKTIYKQNIYNLRNLHTHIILKCICIQHTFKLQVKVKLHLSC